MEPLLLLIGILALLPGISAQSQGVFPDPAYGNQWIFSPNNNGPTTGQILGGPLLPYNSAGVPAENITSVYPHVFPYSEDKLINEVGW
jgi:hypothetical protein